MGEPKFSVRLDAEERHGDYRSVLRVEHNGVLIIEERDGGEPEDNSFVRDWGWVPEALRKAYALGVEDAQRASAAAIDGSCTSDTSCPPQEPK